MNDLSVNRTTFRVLDGDGATGSTQKEGRTESAITPVPLSTHERCQRWLQGFESRGGGGPSRADIQEFLASLAPSIDSDGKLYCKGDEGLPPEEREFHIRIEMLGAIHHGRGCEIEDMMIRLRQAGRPYVEIYDTIKRHLDETAPKKPAPETPGPEPAPETPTAQTDDAIPPSRPAPEHHAHEKVIITGSAAAMSLIGGIVLGPWGLFAGIALLPLFVFFTDHRGREVQAPGLRPAAN